MLSSYQQQKGFTLIEVLVVIAVLGIILAIAVPNMMDLINKNRSDSSADGFVRVFQKAQSHAIQSGKSTQVLIGSTNLANCGNKNVAWAVIETGNTASAILCLTSDDFAKRFNGGTFACKLGDGTTCADADKDFTFSPLGIASTTNESKVKFSITANGNSKNFAVYPGGTIFVE